MILSDFNFSVNLGLKFVCEIHNLSFVNCLYFLRMADEQKITKEVVKKVADLARLNLTDEEVDRFTGQLAVILDAVSVLNKVDTDGVLPTRQVTGLTNQFEEDEICDFVPDKRLLLDQSAGEIVDNQIVVPSVF